MILVLANEEQKLTNTVENKYIYTLQRENTGGYVSKKKNLAPPNLQNFFSKESENHSSKS